MVTTRAHAQQLQEPTAPTPILSSSTDHAGAWAHTPSNLTIGWLAISLPLVLWDAGYCLLRPLSMPGGSLHYPIWAPYELYGKVDYIYGWKAFNEHNGFTNAQTFMNLVETAMYLYYLYVVFAYGRQSSAQGRGAPSGAGFLSGQRWVDGKVGARAVLVGNAAAVMTVAKTLLYCRFSEKLEGMALICVGLNEYYSGFENIGHNSARDLLFLWIIPK